jgi:hypothetical protein
MLFWYKIPRFGIFYHEKSGNPGIKEKHGSWKKYIHTHTTYICWHFTRQVCRSEGRLLGCTMYVGLVVTTRPGFDSRERIINPKTNKTNYFKLFETKVGYFFNTKIKSRTVLFDRNVVSNPDTVCFKLFLSFWIPGRIRSHDQLV